MLAAAASAHTRPPPHRIPPLLSKVISVTTADTDTTANYVKKFKRLTAVEWLTNNRWLYHQSLTTQLRVLLCLTRLSLPLVRIDTHLLANAVFEYMARPEALIEELALSEAEQSQEYTFELPSGIYGLLIERLSEPAVDCATMTRVVQTILKNLVGLIGGDRPYFSRAHILTLYEKLRTLFIRATTPTGTPRFAHLVETVVGLSKYRHALAPTAGSASEFRLKCLQTVHHTLLATTFRTLACRAHYEDLDVIFHYCRQALRSSLLQWLSQLDMTELDAVWSRCPHIVAYCLAHAFKLRPQFHPQSAIALKCAAVMTTDEQQLFEGTGSSIALLHGLNTDGTPKGLWTRLQTYPVQARRMLLGRLMDELDKMSNNEDGGDTTPASNCARALFTTHARQIVRLMNVKVADFERVIHFYQGPMAWTVDKVFDTQRWSDITRARLQQWMSHLSAVPLRSLRTFVDDMVARMTRLTNHNNNNHTHTFNFRTLQCLQSTEDKLKCLLSHPLGHIRHIETVRHMLKALGELVAIHMNAFQINRYHRIRHLVRCLLLLEHVLTRPECNGGAAGTPDECAICYNEVPGTMHTLACGHSFHPECVLQLAQFASHTRHMLPYLAKCPYCTSEIQPQQSVFHALHNDTTTPEWRLALHCYVYTV